MNIQVEGKKMHKGFEAAMSLCILQLKKVWDNWNIMNIALNTEKEKSRNEGRIGFLR